MAEFDAYRETYRDSINQAISFSGQSLDFFTKAKAEYLLELFDRELPDQGPLKALDVGCGHGDIHGFVLGGGRVIDLFGVDVAETVVEEARMAHPAVNYRAYDGTALPYEDGAFDAAYTICVMHHVPPSDWRRFLIEMSRIVRPGGLVAVFEHNPFNPLTRRIVNNCPIDRDAVLLRSGQLRQLASEAGLEAVRCRFIIFTPFEASIFKRLDRWLGWLPLGSQYFVAGRVPAT